MVRMMGSSSARAVTGGARKTAERTKAAARPRAVRESVVMRGEAPIRFAGTMWSGPWDIAILRMARNTFLANDSQLWNWVMKGFCGDGKYNSKKRMKGT